MSATIKIVLFAWIYDFQTTNLKFYLRLQSLKQILENHVKKEQEILNEFIKSTFILVINQA